MPSADETETANNTSAARNGTGQADEALGVFPVGAAPGCKPTSQGEELEPNVAWRAGFGAPIVRQFIDDVETESAEVLSVRSRLDWMEVRRPPRLLDLNTQASPVYLDGHSKYVLAVLGSILHGVRHQLAHHQPGVVASRSQRPRREGVIQRRPCEKGGFGCGRQDHLTADI